MSKKSITEIFDIVSELVHNLEDIKEMEKGLHQKGVKRLRKRLLEVFEPLQELRTFNLDNEYKIYNEEYGISFSFNKSHTVNVYDNDGNEVDVFSIGDFSMDEVSYMERLRAIDDYISRLNHQS